MIFRASKEYVLTVLEANDNSNQFLISGSVALVSKRFKSLANESKVSKFKELRIRSDDYCSNWEDRLANAWCSSTKYNSLKIDNTNDWSEEWHHWPQRYR